MGGTVFEPLPRSLVPIHLGGVVIAISDPGRRHRCSLRLWTWRLENSFSFHFISFSFHFISFHHDNEQQWTKNRTLMYPNFYIKFLTFTILNFTAVVTSSYIDLITFIIHYSTPTCFNAHQTTFRETLSKAFLLNLRKQITTSFS